MTLHDKVSGLIRQIYSAGPDAAAWGTIPEQVLNAVGAHMGLMTAVDLADGEFETFRFIGRESSRVDQGMAEYKIHYEQDPTLQWATANPRGRFCDSAQTRPADCYLSDPFVQWGRSCFGATHWFVGFTPPSEHLSFSLSAFFPAERGPGSRNSLRLFRTLFDHLQCAVELQTRRLNAESREALVLLDVHGAIRQATDSAAALLRSGGAVTVQKGHLTAARGSDQAALDTALQTVGMAHRTGAGPQAVKLAHPKGGRPWILLFRPLISAYGPFPAMRCEVLVEIQDTMFQLGSLEVVRQLFGLTGREVELIRHLGEGHSVESLSFLMDVSVSTARAHLRSIFHKTGSTRQVELLQLCSRLQV